jgi:HK97 family phage prohead protease
MLQRNNQIETRRAPATVAPKSYDAEKRTFEAVISTGAPVKRKDAQGVYIERLDLTAIDPATLAGIPVLTEHSGGDFNAHVGTIVSARFVDGNLVANIWLTSASNADVAAQKIQDGVLHSLSIGYSVAHWTDGKDPKTGGRVRTATAWEIKEVSLVAMPADAGATVRNSNMPNENLETKPLAPEAGVIAHRAAVRDIAKRSGLNSEWADSQIDSGSDIADVKAAAHDQMIARAAPITVRQIGASSEDPAIILQRRVDGLVSNITGQAPKPESREYAGLRFSEHVRDSLQANGISTRGMGNEEVFKRAAMMTVSDFPQLLSGVGNRLLLPAYEANRSPLIKLFAKQNRTDFRAASSLRISEMGELQKVTEAGEIKAVGRTETASSYLMDTYAGMFTLSRKALINDDLGAFADSSRAFGQAAATTEAKLMVALLESNPVMAEDSTALFHTAKHGNLAATPSVIDVANLSAARKALRDMKGLDGKTPIAVTPKYIVVSSDRETEAEIILTDIQPNTTSAVNVFGGKLELLVDPRLAAKTWYVGGDPSQAQCLAYAVLGGNDAPTVEVSNLFDVLGTSVRAYHDFGVGAQDWRGLFKNAGV